MALKNYAPPVFEAVCRLAITLTVVIAPVAQATPNNFLLQPHLTPIQLTQSTIKPILTLDPTADKPRSLDTTANNPVHLVPSYLTAHSPQPMAKNRGTQETKTTHTDTLARIHKSPLYLSSTTSHAAQTKPYMPHPTPKKETSPYQLQLGHPLSQADRLHPIQQQRQTTPSINYQLMLSSATLPPIHNEVSIATPNSPTAKPSNMVKTTTNYVPNPNNTYIAPFSQQNHAFNQTVIQELPKTIVSLTSHNPDIKKMMLLFAANESSHASAYIPPIPNTSDVPHDLSQYAPKRNHDFIQSMAGLPPTIAQSTFPENKSRQSRVDKAKTTTVVAKHTKEIPVLATNSGAKSTTTQPARVVAKTTMSSFIASAPLTPQSTSSQAHAIIPALDANNNLLNSLAKAPALTMAKQAPAISPPPTAKVIEDKASDTAVARNKTPLTKQPTTHYLYTLTEVLSKTVHTNPEILTERANWLRSEHLINEARGSFYPSINFQFNFATETSRTPTLREQAIDTIDLNRRSTNVVVSQLLFDGGNVYNRFKNAESSSQAAKFRLVSTKQTVVLGAIEAYVNVLRYTQLKRLALLHIETHEQAYAKVNQRFKAGAGRSSDLELAAARLALAKATLQNVIDSSNRARFSFIRLTGIEPEKLQPIEVPSKLLPADVTQAEHLGLTKNPSIKEANAQITAALASIKVANASFFPRVNFNVSSSHDMNIGGIRGSNDSEQMGVEMSYNIFKGGSDVATKRAAIEEYRSTQQNAENVKRTILQNIRTSWSSYQLLKKRLPLLKIHLGAMINTAESYREQFKLGQRSLLDELNANTEIFNAQNNVTDAKFQLVINAYVLLFETGQLYSS